MSEEIVERLKALIDRHTGENGSSQVAVAELLNVIEPGSAPMYPEEPGWGATCSICAPDGDGLGSRYSKLRPEKDRYVPRGRDEYSPSEWLMKGLK
jgi:hypothetical protein